MILRELVHDFLIFAKYHELIRVVQYLGFSLHFIYFLTVYSVHYIIRNGGNNSQMESFLSLI